VGFLCPEGSSSIAFKGNRKEILETVGFDPAFFFDRNQEFWRKFPQKLAAGSAR
jgi:hypothetical protein